MSMIEGEIGVDPFGEDKPRHLGEEVEEVEEVERVDFSLRKK
ncbi:MAG: hypothetical protein ABSG71_11950 [Thermodesulfobacteriota bacterium]